MTVEQYKQYLIDNCESMTIADMSLAVDRSHGTVAKMVCILKKQGLIKATKSRHRNDLDLEQMEASIKKLRAHYLVVGEGRSFKDMLEAERKKNGFPDSNRWANAVGSFMNQRGIEGRYGALVRGTIPFDDEDLGIRPAVLTLQKWNGDLRLSA